jgi:SAM-dependent methyltransferase
MKAVTHLYSRLTGSSFVYDHVRPFLVGGVDNSPGYDLLDVQPDDVVVDVGCGTGDALNHLRAFKTYVGFDVDERALEVARRRAARLGKEARFEARELGEADLERLAPTRVMLAGLLHHLPDDHAVRLLSMLARAPSVRRIATVDIVYLDGEHLSNALAFLDRGRECRRVDGYLRLARRAGLRVVEDRIVRCHPTRGRAKYLDLALEPIRDDVPAASGLSPVWEARSA